MREIFSVRFFAAVGVIVGLFFVLTVVFAAGQAIDGDGAPTPTTETHRIDFVEQVFSAAADDGMGLRFTPEGLVVARVDLVIDGTRSLGVAPGTPGVDLCPQLGRPGACAIVADLLGDGVVWFALVPMGDDRTVPLPAIDVLVDGWARLVNGWELRYAPILDRRCSDERGADVEFASYREFRTVLGDDFTSLYSIESAQIEAVVCHARVDYAPPPVSTPTSIPTSIVPTSAVPGTTAGT